MKQEYADINQLHAWVHCISTENSRVTGHCHHVPPKAKTPLSYQKCSSRGSLTTSPPWPCRQPGSVLTLHQLVDVFRWHSALTAGQRLKLSHQGFQSPRRGGLIPDHRHRLASWDPKLCHPCCAAHLKPPAKGESGRSEDESTISPTRHHRICLESQPNSDREFGPH